MANNDKCLGTREFPNLLYGFKKNCENTWKTKTICARWIQKSPNFIFLEDVYDRKSFSGP
jgi:hypothetical protein